MGNSSQRTSITSTHPASPSSCLSQQQKSSPQLSKSFLSTFSKNIKNRKKCHATLAKCLECTHIIAEGQNDKGQLGLGVTTEERLPLRPIAESVTLSSGLPSFGNNPLTSVKMVAAGRSHFLLVTNSNKLYGLGLNNYSQTGYNRLTHSNLTKLTEIQIPAQYSSITGVAAGWLHSIIILDYNKVYCVGHCSFGQLFSNEFSEVNKFTKVTTLEFVEKESRTVTDVSCATFSSSIVVDGWKIHACGEMNGNSNQKNFSVPHCEIFKESKIKTFKHTDHGLIVLQENGNVYCCNNQTPFHILMQQVACIAPSHMYDTIFFLKQHSSTLSQFTLSDSHASTHHADYELALLKKEHSIHSPTNQMSNLDIYCGYCYYYLVLNKKVIYSIEPNGLQKILSLEGVPTSVRVKQVISSSDATYYLFEEGSQNATSESLNNKTLHLRRMKNLLNSCIHSGSCLSDVTIQCS